MFGRRLLSLPVDGPSSIQIVNKQLGRNDQREPSTCGAWQIGSRVASLSPSQHFKQLGKPA
jgi:hypothetical protein